MKIGRFLKKQIQAIAPRLGMAIGGPLGGAAVQSLSNALLGKPDGTHNELEQALAVATPEQLAAIKQAENDFEVRMAELGFDLEELAVKDRSSARDMQVKIRSRIVPVLASVTVVAFFLVVGWVLSGKVTLESTLLGFVLGQVSAKAEQVYNFYFGSSEGSKQKTELQRSATK